MKKIFENFFLSGNPCKLWVGVLALMYAVRRHWPLLNWALLLLAFVITILYDRKHRYVSHQDDSRLNIDLAVCSVLFLWALYICLKK